MSDLEAASSIHGPSTGDLTAAACSVCWHVEPTDLSAAKHRAEWSCQQQKDLLQNDSTTRFVKVVDTDAQPGEQIVALGRWHEYMKGYEHMGDLEVTGLKDRNDPTTWPEGLNKPFYTGFLDQCFAQRRAWMGEGHYWGTSTSLPPSPPQLCLH